MSDKSLMSAALKRAIETIGSPSKTARALGCTPQAVDQWEICPVKRVLAVEAATNGAVSRHDLRPDFYPATDEVTA